MGINHSFPKGQTKNLGWCNQMCLSSVLRTEENFNPQKCVFSGSDKSITETLATAEAQHYPATSPRCIQSSWWIWRGHSPATSAGTRPRGGRGQHGACNTTAWQVASPNLILSQPYERHTLVFQRDACQ